MVLVEAFVLFFLLVLVIEMASLELRRFVQSRKIVGV